VTTPRFKTVESPFKADNSASNQCGFTLMNNQVGAVIAQVMATKPNVSVRYLPSMIRVDATGRMDVDYDEVSEALGEEPGFFDAAEFEENMSTHYGRMVHLDDKTIMFANPEDAAEYIGFDLTVRLRARWQKAPSYRARNRTLSPWGTTPGRIL
jgi:propane monooxygenase coupling protein